MEYGIETSYDSCTYPGIKCKYSWQNKEELNIHVQKCR